MTPQLALRRFTVDDAPFIVTLVNDPDWVRNIGDFNVRSVDDAVAYLNDRILPAYEKYGYGLLCLELADSSEPIGMCGLVNRPQLDLPDLGFALMPDYRRRGYTQRASQKILDLARTHWGINRVQAITNPDNLPSQALLTALGFQPLGSMLLQEDGPDVLLLQVELAEQSDTAATQVVYLAQQSQSNQATESS